MSFTYGSLLLKVYGGPVIRNAAGGVVFEIDDWQRLDRFLILGSDAGTYYVSPQKLTQENAECVKRVLAIDAYKAIQRMREISHQGLAPRQDPVIFALAIACCGPSIQGVKEVFNDIIRTSSHLLMFVSFVSKMRGFGRGLRRIIQDWFNKWEPEQLTYQAIKYWNRHDWTLQDVMRVSHATPWHELGDDRVVAPKRKVYEWIAKGRPFSTENQLMVQHHNVHQVETHHRELVARSAVSIHGYPREGLPTELLSDIQVWEALLDKMPPTATLRNLGKMASLGIFSLNPRASSDLRQKLSLEALQKARIHPIQVYLALRTYQQGKGDKGKLTWPVDPEIVKILEDVFDLSFRCAEPTGKDLMLALDISGSMDHDCLGATNLTAYEAAAIFGNCLARVEPHLQPYAFHTTLSKLEIEELKSLKLANNLRRIYGSGGTQMSLVFERLLYLDKKVDALVIVTDNETWVDNHRSNLCESLLQQYRDKVNPDVKVITVACTATKHQVISPVHPNCLGVVGFDASAVQVIQGFIRG